MLIDPFKHKLKKSPPHSYYRLFWQHIHIDIMLFSFLLLLCTAGLLVLYSTTSQTPRMIEFQFLHLLFAFSVMFIFAQISPATLQRSAPWIYLIGLILLIIVSIMGHIGKGAQRWLDIGVMHFQPAELMKLAIPLLLAWYYHKIHLPITTRSILIAIPIILIPALLTAKQPDLSTASLLFIAGCSILFLAGLSWQIIITTFLSISICIPFTWHFLHDYQRQRVMTFLNPERDPLGNGYHIIQSKIAIGSGGIFGKGWLNGTQSNLHFLPEHATDFIFAVCGEEFGFI
ncbi:MAG: rod shape-determining protein RodA, partial [Gammaproteobacteria bacterium]|nr:rod shape-determining protein RodA [Gammaproteobacteria bacterium]